MVSLLWQHRGKTITPIKGECPAIKTAARVGWWEIGGAERHKEKMSLSSNKNKRVETHGRTDKDTRVI